MSPLSERVQPELQNNTTNCKLASYYNWGRLSCRLQYAFHSTYFRLQLIDQVITKLMKFDEPCLGWAPYMPRTTVQEYPVLNQNVPLGTGTYCMPEQE